MSPTRWIGVAAAVAVLGCGRSVMVPPRVDLAPLATLGIVQFVTPVQGNLGEYATERFVEMMRESQGSIPIVEIGTREDALKAVGADKFDVDAVRALGQKYRVRHVILGTLDVSEIRPHVSVNMDPSGASGVSAGVTATLTTKIVDTETGASIWNASASRRGSVGFIEVFGGHIAFNARDPDRAYSELINPLVKDVTRDFRPTHEHR